MLGTSEMMVIGVIVLLLFGPSKLPELGKGIGEFITNVKKGMNTVENGGR